MLSKNYEKDITRRKTTLKKLTNLEHRLEKFKKQRGHWKSISFCHGLITLFIYVKVVPT